MSNTGGNRDENKAGGQLVPVLQLDERDLDSLFVEVVAKIKEGRKMLEELFLLHALVDLFKATQHWKPKKLEEGTEQLQSHGASKQSVEQQSLEKLTVTELLGEWSEQLRVGERRVRNPNLLNLPIWNAVDKLKEKLETEFQDQTVKHRNSLALVAKRQALFLLCRSVTKQDGDNDVMTTTVDGRLTIKTEILYKQNTGLSTWRQWSRMNPKFFFGTAQSFVWCLS